MNETLHLEIVTPFGTVLDEPVESCVLPGQQGSFQVLKNHAAIVSNVDIGLIKIERDAHKEYFATSGGFCEVKDNVIRIVVESAEQAETIDVQRAQKAKERAEERLRKDKDDVDFVRAEVALKRAVNRLKAVEIVKNIH
ncbi:MAG: F0F1 ATP synthase subunit epsilon [Calditrichaeota bacterium]|nr:MAG: F0F1 ATP synthase subunit epsilon [Calditrichota bacterium]